MLRRFALMAVALVLLAGAAAFWARQRIAAPFRGYAAPEVFVDLPPGSSVTEIAGRLSAAGVVVDPISFRLAVWLARADRRLQAGEYRFSGATPATEVVARLARGDVFTRPVTFPEGLTIGEMAPIFEKSGLGAAADFVRASSDISLIANVDPDARNLEGYLFPETYALPRRAGASGTVQTMVKAFTHAFDGELRAAARARGLSAREVVTLASLIEKETAQPDERAVVSAVYHNRLRIRMPLQCDPTVIYALMLRGKWNGNLRREDLQIDSPYNTYRYGGLPPGPIASPGRASLEAAVRPAPVPYLYFVSRNDGTHVFATSLAEHNRNVRRWQIGRR